VTVAGTTSGVSTPSNTGVNVGDMVIANITKASAIVAADFDGVDNTESADLVKLAATQTLTNKTIDADQNTITNIETMDFKSGVIDTDGTLTANSDLKLATQKATKTYVDGKTAGRTKKYVGHDHGSHYPDHYCGHTRLRDGCGGHDLRNHLNSPLCC